MLKVVSVGLVVTVVGAVAADAPELLPALLAASVALVLLALVVAARNTRRAGVLMVCLLVPAATATGIDAIGPVSIAELVPLAILGVTFLPGVVRADRSRADVQQWAIRLLTVMALGGWIAAAVGNVDVIPILQFTLTTLPVVLAANRLDPDETETHWLLIGLVLGILASTLLGVAGLRSPSGRALGVAHHSNQFAMQIALASPLLWLLWRKGKVPGAAAILGFLVLFAGILQSGSRSGLIALAFVVVVWAWRELGPGVSVAIAACITGIAALGALPSFDTPTTERLLQPDLTANSNDERLSLMRSGLARVAADPILGEGLPRTDLPHNVFLLVWTGMGLAGLIAFLVLVWRIGRLALSRTASLDQWLMSLSLMGFLVAISVNNSIGTPVAWLVIGILQSSYLGRRGGPSSPRAVGPVGMRFTQISINASRYAPLVQAKSFP